jgi:L-threonylcarbamoyladenylate synthase
MRMNNTVIYRAEQLIEPQVQHHLRTVIRQGGLVIFPTETVYGIGGHALDPLAAASIYAAKGRPSDNPLIVHVARFDQIDALATIDQPYVKALAQAFWPGPMTLVLRKKALVPDGTTGGLPTVALRIPSHPVAQALLTLLNVPVAAPSANRSGKPSSTRFDHVMGDFNGKVAALIDGGDVPIGLESTVIDATGPLPVILRPGAVTQAMVEKVLDHSILDQSETEIDGAPKSPGMKYKHYAPLAKLEVITGPDEAVLDFLRQALQADPNLAILGPSELIHALRQGVRFDLGSRAHPEAIAQTLFSALRALDDQHITHAYFIALSEEGLGKAIMNRVHKAANHRLITLTQSSNGTT